MDTIKEIGKEAIGFTYKVNLDKIHENIEESVKEGYSMENFLKNILGYSQNKNAYSIEFFICNYDDKYNEYWLSNGSIVVYGNLIFLRSCKIISNFIPNLQNKLISEYLIDPKKSIEYLPCDIKQNIKKYRKAIQLLYDIPN
jgi:hypothetical protein